MSLLERFQGSEGQLNTQEALSRHTSLRNDLEVINAFIKQSEVIVYPPGHVLIQKGDTDRDILYILAGEVSIEINGDTSKRRRSGQHVGEMAMVNTSAVRSATVRAIVETAVLKVSVRTFSTLADGDKGFLWKHIAIEICDRLNQRLTDIKHPHRLVLLIHGIRTRAEWQHVVKHTLEDEHTTVTPIKYGFFDLLSFWCPFFTRARPVKKIEEKIRSAISDTRYTEVVVIAHSFGTYAISKILQRNPWMKIQRLLLCGGIVSDDFKWGSLPNRPLTILNDCGHRDWYPVLASGFSFGYGATGVFGYGTSEVTDRFFNCGHSDFFTKDFVNEHWKPFVETGHIERSLYDPETKSWLMSVSANKFIIWMLTLMGVLIVLMTVLYVAHLFGF
ncbi:MAG: cyclic nucleotide-binding domain-containing protein [Verrucomicrobiota bacterium]